MQGISADFILSANLTNGNLLKYKAYVIYRCEHTSRIASFIAAAHALGRPVLYDIDDYIFDYEAIKDLPFMANPEYRDFASRSQRYRGLHGFVRCVLDLDRAYGYRHNPVFSGKTSLRESQCGKPGHGIFVSSSYSDG